MDTTPVDITSFVIYLFLIVSYFNLIWSCAQIGEPFAKWRIYRRQMKYFRKELQDNPDFTDIISPNIETAEKKDRRYSAQVYLRFVFILSLVSMIYFCTKYLLPKL